MIEAMKQALEALEGADSIIWSIRGITPDDICDAITSLRQAIEQAEKQEPFGWVSQHTVKGPYEWQFNKELSGVYRDNAISILPIYTTPQPQEFVCSTGLCHYKTAAHREWVGLTDEEIDDLAEIHGLDFMSYSPFTRAIEAKLKEKNHG